MTQRTQTQPLLRPRDYAIPDYAFGTTGSVRWHIPAGGDELSRNLARLQHHLMVAVETRPDPQAELSKRPRKDPTDRNAVARMCRRWQFSRSYWQTCKTGRSWFNVKSLAATTELLMEQLPGDLQSPGGTPPAC